MRENGRAAPRAIVLHPCRSQPARVPGRAERQPADSLEEAVGLVRAIGVAVAESRLVPCTRPVPATLIGRGKVAELAARVQELGCELVVIDAALSPVQQRNLERAWGVKVIDRTSLILEIFGRRARTREGELQVELAHLTWQRSRLVRSWTHLERQRGGFGFLGGPGETQIEADRRLIDDRIAHIRRQLGTVTRTRALHRRQREKAPFPVIALVGYTNAGKSTLFNRLTRSGTLVADMLFATLDPTMRGLRLGGGAGRKVILSDTVGFISDLPTDLVAAFRATLEEVRSADLIVHVRDISHPDSEAQRADVEAILDQLGVGPACAKAPPMIEAWNKIDRLDTAMRETVLNRAARDQHRVALSALTGAGIAELCRRIDAVLAAEDREIEITLGPEEGRALAWLHRNGRILSRKSDAAGATRLSVRLDPVALARFEKATGYRVS
ncbi:MAG: GTPase HflX [Alphaproteobacteria bacterium]|nr:MAG: GTPase HflX [Alphaproteobacteria bacterium]